MNAPYSVVADPVRLDNRLSPMARLFYAEVCGNLTVRHGAIIDDKYYANLFDCSDRQVRNWRNELVKFGYTIEKTDTTIGMKCIYPTKTVEEKILAFEGLKKPKILDITYTTRDGKILKNPSEAKMHYQSIINATSIPDDKKSKLKFFINTFLECIFDDSYFGKLYAKQKFTKEFAQFILDSLTIDEIYTKALYTFSEEKFSDIRQPDYYVLTILSNYYKDEFNSKILRNIRNEKRKEFKKLW